MFKTKGVDPITLLLVLVIGIASFMSGFFSPRITKPPPKDEGLIVLEKKNFLSQKGLQIDTLLFGTPTPTPPPPAPPLILPSQPQMPPQVLPPQQPPPSKPANSCFDAGYVKDCSECCAPSDCQNKDIADNFIAPPGPDPGPEYPFLCMAKPVIYLYPEKPGFVNIEVKTEGKIVISDPLYPTGGWKNVLAYPNGDLFYQGKKYRELFYETSVQKVESPKKGLVIPVDKIEDELKNAMIKTGLNSFEQGEFLEYWIPILKGLNSPYILFSLIDKSEKEKLDKLVIEPKPQTLIEFLAYFKPLESPIDIDPLVLPSKPPKRLGFTAVEWGGTIDH